MAALLEDNLNLNDMERQSAVAVKTIDASEGYASGDVLFVGMIPRECVATDIRIVADPAFDGTFDLGFIGDFPDIAINPIATAVVTADNGTTVIDMPNTGVILADGTALPSTDKRGSIWAGEYGLNLGLKFNGDITKGLVRIIVTYSYYGTKDGAYGLGTIPMTPYQTNG